MSAYYIVLATRNRPEALRLSIPLMLAQSRPAKCLIVVDSSDNHRLIRETVEEATSRFDIRYEVIDSRPGSSHQRNVGLRQVKAPVVIFPDDDSIWHPGTADAIMRVYERDTGNAVVGVCAAEAVDAPKGFGEGVEDIYCMETSHRLKQRIGHARARFEKKWFPDPFIMHGQENWSRFERPNWLGDENEVLVEWMTGFRMSFRTEAIRACGFDETFAGYALFEDVDASFAVATQGLLVGARNAQVYHYRKPGGRGNERRLGVTQILNRAYVVAKHSPSGNVAQRRLLRYGRYKIAQYLTRTAGRTGRERVVGARASQRWVSAILAANQADLARVYQDAIAACLAEENVGADENAEQVAPEART